ncbi:thiol reductant ABC exporter subunit CydC [Leucobacter zeae]|nr:thiol reductant ABC exporter subunit CydC [Leucobacter zeae]
MLRGAVPRAARRAPGILFGVLADACVVGLLGLSMWLIVRSGEQPPILHLTFAIVGVRALAIGRAAFRYAERLASHDAALAQIAALRASTFDALVPRIPGALDSRRRGEVLATFVDDVDQLQDEAVRVRQPLVVSGFVVALSLIAVALLSPVAALVLTVVLGAAGAAAVALANRISAADDRELAAARAGLVDALLDRFAAAEVLAAFGGLGAQRRRIAQAEDRLARVQQRRARSAGLSGAVLSFGAGIASLIILLALLPGITGSSAAPAPSAPVIAALVVVPAAVFEVFAQVPVALAARRVVRASAARVADLVGAPIPIEVPTEIPLESPAVSADGSCAPGAVAVAPPRDASVPGAPPLIAVRDLVVRRPGRAEPVVNGIDFELRAGETVVVTGESGSGKTSLAEAMVGFLAYGGSYRVRGVEAAAMPPAELRSVVGLCEQQPHLFDTDLRQNLRFASDRDGSGGADDAVLLAALERVGLGGWVEERGGLDAPVGERGALVSGGQAQRIALARAILADFPVVILDEPTAGVDREVADRLLRDLLGAVPPDRAVMLITHTDLPDGLAPRRLVLGRSR